MGNRILPVICGLFLVVTPVARGQSHTDPDPGLTRLRQAWLSAYNTGDAEAMRALYVEDAVRMPYDAPEQVGRAAILSSYRDSFTNRRFDPDLRFEVNELRVLGEVALERGDYHEILKPRDGGRRLIERGKYVALARRMPDGSWRYEWSIFNRDAPPEPASG